MPGVRKLYFISIAVVMLAAPALCRHLEQRPAESYLEGRKRPELTRPTWRAVVSEEAQSTFDAALAFGVPHRDGAMLAYARHQRRMIGFAARLFGFDAWPTYYGSRHCHVASVDAIAEIPLKASPAQARRFETAAREYAEIMAAYPKARCFFALVDASPFSLAGPLHDLVGDPVDYDYAREHFLARLPKSCTAIDLGYGREDDLYLDYFRTDHHWRMQGAVRAYGKIAAALGIAPIAFGPPAPAVADEFFGSQARYALDADVAGDVIYDVAYERSPLRIEAQGVVVPDDAVLDFGHSGLPYVKTNKFEDMYNGYCPAWADLHIANERAAGGSLLIVGGSYSQCMERFFAESYRETHKLAKPLFMADFLASHQVDDILFLYSPDAIAKGDGHTR